MRFSKTTMLNRLEQREEFYRNKWGFKDHGTSQLNSNMEQHIDYGHWEEIKTLISLIDDGRV